MLKVAILMHSEVGRFLEALFGAMPDELYILIWTLPSKTSRWFRSVEDAASYVEKIKSCNGYVGVGLSPSDFGAYCRCESEIVAIIVGVGADIDLRSDAHPKATLPGSVDQALSILPPEFPPSIAVLTGNGLHIWWQRRR